MNIEYPDNFSIESYQDTFLWRYVDIHKLLDLLNNKQIHFTRFDHFEDGLEGLTGKGIALKAFTQGEPITKKNIHPNFDAPTQERIINQDKRMRQDYLNELTKAQQTQFASCWFLGTRESIAMWKIYSRSEGVAIKFNAKQLIETIIASAQSNTNTDFKILYFGPVDYKNIWPFDPRERFDGKFNGLKKDKSYSHENEFRFVSVCTIKKTAVYSKFSLPIGELSTFNAK